MDVVTLGSASVRLSTPKFMNDPNLRELTALHVPEEDRGKGYATALMADVCRQADEQRHVLVLYAKPYDSAMKQEKLEAWYAKFGFTVIQQDPRLMARPPMEQPREVSIVKAVKRLVRTMH